jgi:hypothetical protein
MELLFGVAAAAGEPKFKESSSILADAAFLLDSDCRNEDILLVKATILPLTHNPVVHTNCLRDDSQSNFRVLTSAIIGSKVAMR